MDDDLKNEENASEEVSEQEINELIEEDNKDTTDVRTEEITNKIEEENICGKNSKFYIDKKTNEKICIKIIEVTFF